MRGKLLSDRGNETLLRTSASISRSRLEPQLAAALRGRCDGIGAHFADPIRVNPQFRTKLAPLIQQVKSLGLEGVVAKRCNSIYIPGKVSEAGAVPDDTGLRITEATELTWDRISLGTEGER